MISASGILLLAPDDTALFLKRGPGGDHAGEWCFPGGKIEGDETAEQAAARECEEETGAKIDPKDLVYLARTQIVAPPTLVMPAQPVVSDIVTVPEAVVAPTAQPAEVLVDFTTFTLRVRERFEPRPDKEHVGHAWAPVGEPPQPLHPGCAAALARFAMSTELDVARAIAAGQLTSPQKYANFWLFAMRVTGTGAAYRRSWDEYVWRDPSIYMNDEFLARCNGLPIILEHPYTSTLNSREYARRNIGTSILPFLRPEANEVWTIARVIDETAAHLMETKRLSTSPAVVFHDPDVNTKLTDGDGRTILVEGKPSLLDHLAVCEQGVWDKGGEPRGIESATVKEVTMADEDTRAAEDKARADAEEARKADSEKIDKLLTGIDAVCAKMDSLDERVTKMESAKKDSEEEEKKADAEEEDEKKEDEDEKPEMKADKRKDGEEDEKPIPAADKKKDAARKDSDITKILADVDSLRKMMQPVSDSDRRAFSAAQERADSAFAAFGSSAPQSLMGETLTDYRLRLVGKLQEYSTPWKGRRIGELVRADSAIEGQRPLIDLIEEQVYADAVRAAEMPIDLKPNEMRSVVRTDRDTGQRTVEFRGKRSFVHQFGLPPMEVQGFATPQKPLH